EEVAVLVRVRERAELVSDVVGVVVRARPLDARDLDRRLALRGEGPERRVEVAVLPVERDAGIVRVVRIPRARAERLPPVVVVTREPEELHGLREGALGRLRPVERVRR